ncbi:conserved hypothetical protein [Bacteroides sp. 3_1_23]|nr:conserved hypothetical protein [Bacteroides sp. 3_1_23]
MNIHFPVKEFPSYIRVRDKSVITVVLKASFRYAQSKTYVLCIHSFVGCRRGNLFLKVTHLYGQCTDQPSQLLIRTCFNNRQFHTKIIFRFLNMRQNKAHLTFLPNL